MEWEEIESVYEETVPQEQKNRHMEFLFYFVYGSTEDIRLVFGKFVTKKFKQYAKEFLEIVLREKLHVSKSPYSMSFYAYENPNEKIDWGYKPENSLRLSDHWNFINNGKIHCRTDDFHCAEGIYQYKNGIYTKYKGTL